MISCRPMMGTGEEVVAFFLVKGVYITRFARDRRLAMVATVPGSGLFLHGRPPHIID